MLTDGHADPPVWHRLGLPCGRSEYDPDRRHCAQRQRLGPITQRDSHTSEPRIRSADYALRVDGEFVAAGRRGTAGSGASPALVFSRTGRIASVRRLAIRAPGRAPRQGTDQDPAGRAGECGRIPCGATGRRGPHAKMILSLAVSCCWRQSQLGGRGSRAPVSEPGPAGEPGPGRRLSGSRTARTVPARPAPAGEPFMLMEPQQVQARGYRRQFLPFSSACLINGRGVTCSCWSRSAVLI